MKYDSRFGDAFWNSSEQSWFGYIMRMMTSWAIICNVWYLPPMTKRADEDAVDFANRVKKEIANKGGLVDLEWDGGLKRAKVPPKLVAKQQERYANRLSRYTSVSEVVKNEDVTVRLDCKCLFLQTSSHRSCFQWKSRFPDTTRSKTCQRTFLWTKKKTRLSKTKTRRSSIQPVASEELKNTLSQHLL